MTLINITCNNNIFIKYKDFLLSVLNLNFLFQQAQLNATLVAMEAAALAAMKKDGHEVAEPQSSSSTSSSMPVKRKMKVDPKEELKERKRKLKELKKTAKQSEFWNQDQADEFIEWVQSETGEGQCYYWNIFSGGKLNFEYLNY